MKKIKGAAVLGAGVMGSTIAAHLANAGVKVLLLDIVPKELTEDERAKGLTLKSLEVRNKIANSALQNLLKMKPSPFLLPEYAKLIETGNFEDHLDKIKDCDWVIEVVVENMDIKKNLLKKVVPHLKEHAILSTNTSGLSVNEMATVLPEDVKKRFLVTHFFNPPRYMRLMEIVGCNDCDPKVVEFMADFINQRLGKGIVFCKDTPNFIGNRIGVYSIMKCIHHMVDMGLTVEEVDAITGKPLGRPKSAAFGTTDLVGLDTMVHVANNSYNLLSDDDEREVFKMPDFVLKMVENKQLGRKTRQGFYKREGGQKYYWDYNSEEYRPVTKPKFDSIKFAKMAKTTSERIKALIQGQDRAAEFAWRVLRDTLLYSFKRIPEIADDIVNVDNAMKWGYNWELGPFETFDAIGIDYFVDRAEKEGIKVPDKLKSIKSFYKIQNGKKYFYDLSDEEFKEIPTRKGTINLALIKTDKNKIVESNDNGSVVDIGDGVFCLEFHSPQNSISDDMLDMTIKAVEIAENQGIGLVVGNQGERFSVGANLLMLALGIEQKAFDLIEASVKKFQSATMAMKYAAIPVVAAPFQMTLGGGCEFCLNCDAICAHVETYMGLVEIGVGLLPAGGGTKELCVRAVEEAERLGVNVQNIIIKYFQNIAMAKVSTSASEAFKLGFMRQGDQITMDIDSLIGNAKQMVITLAKTYRPRTPMPFKAPGRDVAASIKSQLWNMKIGNFITEYEYKVASMIADVICGGDVDPGTLITEEYLLRLERDTFVELCKQEKTVERINHMLKTNRPLRN